MDKAVFLDRDGVLIKNEDHYYIMSEKQVEYVENIFANLTLLAKKGCLFFIVSNQGGISKNIYTKEDTLKINRLITDEFSKRGISIKDILFCPHHDSIENCLCRKPKPLMLLKLIAKYKLKKENCYFIGDSDTDMTSARLANITGIKIVPNSDMYYVIKQLLND